MEEKKPTPATVQLAVRENLTTMFEAIVELEHKGEILNKVMEVDKGNGLIIDYTIKLKDVYDLYTIGKGIGYYERMEDEKNKS